MFQYPEQRLFLLLNQGLLFAFGTGCRLEEQRPAARPACGSAQAPWGQSPRHTVGDSQQHPHAHARTPASVLLSQQQPPATGPHSHTPPPVPFLQVWSPGQASPCAAPAPDEIHQVSVHQLLQ